MNRLKLLGAIIVSIGIMHLYGSGRDGEWMYNLDDLEQEYQVREVKKSNIITKVSVSAAPIVDLGDDDLIILEKKEKKSSRVNDTLSGSALKYAARGAPKAGVKKETKKRRKSCSRWDRMFSCCSLDNDSQKDD